MILRDRSALAARANEIYGHTVLRGIAALCVVGYHSMLLVNTPSSTGLLHDFLMNSYLFVDVFFILSGFIMVECYGARLRRPGQKVPDWQHVQKFWNRRFLKILPNYYAALLISLVLAILLNLLRNDTFPVACLARSLGAYIVMAQELSGGVCYNINQPLWSIVTELIAYLAFPVLLLLRPGLLPILAVGFYCTLLVSDGGVAPISGGASVLRTFAGFMFGMYLAHVHAFLSDRVKSALQVPAFLALMGATALGLHGMALAFAGVVVLATASQTGPLTRLSQAKWLYRLGRISFSLYLLHVPFLVIFNLTLHKLEADFDLILFASRPEAIVLGAMVISLGVGTAYYLWIEWPIERALQRWRKSFDVTRTA